MGEAVTLKQDKIEYISALRGLACLFVLFAHTVQMFTSYGSYVSGCGKIGVWFFMVSSGFLTLLPFVIEREKKFSVITYYKRKIIKLYPMYIVVLILAYGMGFLATGKNVFLHIACIEGNGHFWYMPVLFKMYLIMPIFILSRKRIKKEMLYIGVLIACFAICCYFFPFWKYEENSIRLIWYIPVFVLGFLLAEIYGIIKKKEFHTVWGDVLVIVVFFVMLLMTPFFRKLLFNKEPSGWLQNKYLVISLLWICIILGCEIGKLFAFLLSKCKVLIWIGEISYPLYLIHFVLFDFLNKTQMDTVLKIKCGLILSIGLATILPYIFYKLGFLLKTKGK